MTDSMFEVSPYPRRALITVPTYTYFESANASAKVGSEHLHAITVAGNAVTKSPATKMAYFINSP